MQITTEAKNAILNCLANATYANDNAQELYDNLAAAFFPVDSITAVYTQSGTVYDQTPLDSLKADLVVTAHFEGGGSATVTSYTLSGTLTAGTSTITVTYADKTTTFNVTVTDSKIWHLGEGYWINTFIVIAGAATASRGIYVGLSGNDPPIKKQVSSSSTSFIDSDYYFIPIPSGATGIKVTSTNSNVYGIAYAICQDSSLAAGWKRLVQTDWINTSGTLTLPSDATHWSGCIKHGNAGTVAVTSTDTDALSFEFVY